MADNSNILTEIKYIRRDLDAISADIATVKKDVKSGFVSKDLFEVRVGRLEKIVYGLVSIIMTAVTLAVMGLVLIK